MKDNLSAFRLSRKAVFKLKNKENLKKSFAAGEIPQEIIEFSEEVMAKLYESAYTLFQSKKYEEAADGFLFLTTLNPHHHEYWLGLGMATQLCQHYEAAIDAYELAALCDLSSPVPYFYLAKCLFAIHDRESALQALDLAIETAGDSDSYSDLKRQAVAAREILLKDQFLT